MYDEVSKTQAASFYIPLSPYHYGADKENLFGNQEPLKMVIFSLILVTFTFDLRKILRGDFRVQSLLGGKGITMANPKTKWI